MRSEIKCHNLGIITDIERWYEVVILNIYIEYETEL